ncbi:unnamed protein product [Hermetia illucens]|uniref:Uncharacterized protein n=1 Tax=Hermetia illucens TaxID=343691 RepID=A0A7R8V5G8_HERIL|nr:unnamed protein product [Hermetia illucens]
MVAAVSRQNLDVALFVNYSHETFPRISAINAILRRIKYENFRHSLESGAHKTPPSAFEAAVLQLICRSFGKISIF